MKDPYLIPGQVCEVWNHGLKKYTKIKYYAWSNKQGCHYFSPYKDLDDESLSLFHDYRPIGTEWDFSPDWAVCSTVDKTGGLCFWSKIPTHDNIAKWETNNKKCFILNCGVCPEKNRVKNWKESLRHRPDWAKVG